MCLTLHPVGYAEARAARLKQGVSDRRPCCARLRVEPWDTFAPFCWEVSRFWLRRTRRIVRVRASYCEAARRLWAG